MEHWEYSTIFMYIQIPGHSTAGYELPMKLKKLHIHLQVALLG
jgi:hypothetical protein